MEMKNMLLHVGYPKAGSTFLQDNLFKHHSELLDISDYDIVNEIKKSVQMHRRDHFDANMDEYIGFIRELAINNNKSLVLSVESFTQQFTQKDKRDIYCQNTLHERADRLYWIFESVCSPRVLFVIRRQQDIIVSRFTFNYYDFMDSGGFKDFDSFINFSLMNPSYGYISTLFYDAIISKYAELFGKDKILVCLFEELQSDPIQFAYHIAGNMGIDKKEAAILIKNNSRPKMLYKSNKGYIAPSRIYHTLCLFNQKYMNRFIHFNEYKLGRMAIKYLQMIPEFNPFKEPTYIKLNERQLKNIRLLYKDTNRRLANDYGLLDKMEYYGYSLS